MLVQQIFSIRHTAFKSPWTIGGFSPVITLEIRKSQDLPCSPWRYLNPSAISIVSEAREAVGKVFKYERKGPFSLIKSMQIPSLEGSDRLA
jgi:hypothetical protein